MFVVWVIVEIVLLFFLSHILKKELFIRFYLFSKNQTATISFISLLLYPGVVVHEFSHLIAAIILFVRVKSMTLVPKVVEGKIQGGSVVIEKVDVFRRTLVGIAPLFGGLIVLWLITAYLFPLTPLFCRVLQSENGGWFEILRLPLVAQNDMLCKAHMLPITNYQLPITFLSFYLLFSISSTMYSSQKDLEALLYTLPVLVVLAIFLYILGFQAAWIVTLLEKFELVFVNLSVMLGFVLCIQVGVYVLLSLYSMVIKPIRSG